MEIKIKSIPTPDLTGSGLPVPGSVFNIAGKSRQDYYVVVNSEDGLFLSYLSDNFYSRWGTHKDLVEYYSGGKLIYLGKIKAVEIDF